MAINPYKIGDLVRACFTYYEYYTYPYDEEDDLFYPWNGIVVDGIGMSMNFGDDAIYDVALYRWIHTAGILQMGTDARYSGDI